MATSVSNTDTSAVVLTLLPIQSTGMDRSTCIKNRRLLEDKLTVRLGFNLEDGAL